MAAQVKPGLPSMSAPAGASPPVGIGSQKLAAGQKATITGGDPFSRMMGQYGKGHSYVGAPTDPAASDPTKHAGAQTVRGGKGGVKTHPRQGGIGPGPNGSYGSETSYPTMDE
jgi:hypothetical protein